MTERIDRMLGQAPDYYETSAIYQKIQAAQGDEYDSIEAKNADLKAQLRIKTATWGLRYYAEALHIPVVLTDSYDIRRSRVLAKWRSPGNFSAALIKSVCEAFSGGEVAVSTDLAASMITVTFIGVRGIPPNLSDLQAQVDNIIHAHLGTAYKFTYLYWDELDASPTTWDELDALNLTWDEFETWRP